WPRRPNQRPVTSSRSLAVQPKRSTSKATVGEASAVDVGLRAIEGLRLPIPGLFGTRPVAPAASRARPRATYHPRVETSEARGAVRREGLEARVPLAALQRVTEAALAHLALDDVLAELLERVAEVLRSDTAAFLLIDDDDERMLRARAAKGIEEEVEQGVRIPLGVPLIVADRVIGVLHVGTLTPRDFTAEDRDLLQVAADRAALALDHARLFERERRAREESEEAV